MNRAGYVTGAVLVLLLVACDRPEPPPPPDSGSGSICGGIAGFPCPEGQFCDLAPGDCGTIADGAGVCAPTGPAVICLRIYQPVCGCDGKTYSNDCVRQAAGVSKLKDGPCRADMSPAGIEGSGLAGIQGSGRSSALTD